MYALEVFDKGFGSRTAPPYARPKMLSPTLKLPVPDSPSVSHHMSTVSKGNLTSFAYSINNAAEFDSKNLARFW